MQIKCGIDIIEISRIQESIEDTNGRFLERVYTKSEIDYCESKSKVKYQHYAARFAAKEAFFKAISESFPKYDITWKDIEVTNDQNGRPKINMLSKQIPNVESIDISISHCKEYAVASVSVLLK
ncbi:MAG: holo-ACP synthase [Clostridia bacterium]|nr:holo-ACP synthase [Clostridia bacterium]